MIKKVNSLSWALEPLLEDPSFVQRRMFGCLAAYFGGRMVLVLADQKEPWSGIMVCTSREYHESLQEEFPQLKPHLVLGKWLYVSQTDPSFEELASNIVEKIKKGDIRIGIEPKSRRKKTTKRAKK